MFKLSLVEQETIITYNAAEEHAEIYTCYPPSIRKLDKYCKENPEEWKVKNVSTVEGEVVGKTYTAPKKLISFRCKEPKKPELTEEEKNEIGERLKKSRASKK